MARMQTTCAATRQVLVVEDNPADLLFLEENLARHPCIEVTSLPNCVQASAFLLRRSPFAHAPRPDLVVLDLRMPIFPGDTLLAMIKGSEALRRIPVAVFTASERPADCERCSGLGADGYWVKPLEWREWTRVVDEIVARLLGGERIGE